MTHDSHPTQPQGEGAGGTPGSGATVGPGPSRPVGDEPKSPAAAAWLSLVPGLGLVYLGLYVQGLAVLALIFSVSGLHLDDDVVAPLSLSLYAFQIVYAYREARRMNLVQEGKAAPPLIDLDEQSPIWGYVLLGVGALLLLNNFYLGRMLVWLLRLWPVLLIIIGVRMLRQPGRTVGGGAV